LLCQSFNPRPRAAGDDTLAQMIEHRDVSIHARARRATVDCVRGLVEGLVSIHARARRATLHVAAVSGQLKQFQSTPARGGRRVAHDATVRVGYYVSIHARARRATSLDCKAAEKRESFNPRPRAAGDRRCGLQTEAENRFQSTPARGGRPPASSSPERPWSEFQSTPARGGRPIENHADCVRRCEVSIHARARRATWTR